MSEVHGFSTPFRIDPGSGRVARASGEAKIEENLVHLLLTSTGERFMRRGYGGGLRELIHEPNDDALRALVERRVAAAVGQFEPRVVTEDVIVERRGDAVVVELVYRHRETGHGDRVTVPLDVLEVGGR